MKRLVVALAGVVALGMVPSHAADASGTILLPVADASRPQRCSNGTPIPNGVFGWTTNVVAGKSFTLKAGSADGVTDFDIWFGKSLTSCEASSDPVATPHSNVEGDEAGTVPGGATVAIIYMFVGVPNSAFTYDET